jgi:hypothetical protein
MSYGGLEEEFSTFLNFDVNGVEWPVLRLDRFTAGKTRLFPLNKRLKGSQRRSSRFGEEQN